MYFAFCYETDYIKIIPFHAFIMSLLIYLFSKQLQTFQSPFIEVFHGPNLSQNSALLQYIDGEGMSSTAHLSSKANQPISES